MGKELSGWGMVFKTPYSNKKIKHGAKALYALLCIYRNRETSSCFPTDQMLAEEMCTTVQQIQLWLQNLEDNKVIRRETRRNNNRGTMLRVIIILDDVYEEE